MKTINRILWFALVLIGAIITNIQMTANAAPVLQNRYGFTNDASDSVSGQNGTFAANNGSAIPTTSGGAVQLDGIGQYVSLPPNLITNMTALTFEAWLTPVNNAAWARVWDFGNQYTNIDSSTGSSEEFYGTVIYGVGGGMGVQMNGLSGNEIVQDGPLVDSAESHIVWTSDSTTKKARLYVNGVLVSSSNTFSNAPNQLGPLPFEFLGHSLFSADPYLGGSIDEFRIWNGTLNQLQAAASDQSGPDTLSTNYGTVTNIILNVTTSMTDGGHQQAHVIAGASGLTNNAIDVSDLGVAYSSGNTNVLTVDTNGVITAVGLGSTTIAANFQGGSATQTVATVEPVAILTHRYSFTTDASDSVGSATGTLNGSASISGGQLQLTANNTTAPASDYLQLPAGIVTNDQAVTVEAWATFAAPQGGWANLFDFGEQTATDGLVPGNDAYSIFLDIHSGTATTGGDTIAGIDDSDDANAVVDREDTGAGTEMDGLTNVHISVVFNSPLGYEAVYTNGILEGVNTAVTIPLSGVKDIRNIIGADNWPDAGMVGSVDEFRIYNGALTSQQIAVSDISGTGSTNIDPGALQSLTVQLPSTMPIESAINPGVLANYANLTNYNLARNAVTPITGLTITSSASNVVALAADNLLHSYNPGTATVTATYQGETGSANITVIRPPEAVLAHRYSFTTDASDSVGGANGTLEGDATVTNGQVSLDGVSGTYVDLPGGLISGYQATTIEEWVSVGASAGWSYLFAFGNTVGESSPGVGGTGVEYLHFVAETGFGTSEIIDAHGNEGAGVENLPPLDGQTVHVVCVDDPANGILAIYTNGVPAGITYGASIAPLSTIATNFSYIGHSLWDADPYLTANIDEFRIYNGRLFSSDIANNQVLGPNQLPTPTGLPSATISGNNIIVSWPTNIVGASVVSRTNLVNGASWSTVGGSPAIVGGSYQLSVPISGSAQFFRLSR